jgi:hypothetical protein
MSLLVADSFTYQFYRTEKSQNDRSPVIDTGRLHGEGFLSVVKSKSRFRVDLNILTSSLSLGVPVPRGTQCIRGV